MAQLLLLDEVSGNSATGATNGPGMGVSGTWIFTVKADDFGGGSVSLQISDDNGDNWLTPDFNGVPNAFTENTVIKVDFIPNEFAIRAVLSGATSAVNVSAILSQTT